MAEPDKPPKRKRGRPRKTAKAPEPDLAHAAAEAAAQEFEKGGGSEASGAGTKPKGGDTPPASEQAGTAPRKPRRRRVSKQVTQQIEDALAEMLCLPAVPAAVFGDQWAADHFTTQGREFANKIAVMSERYPELRKWCERLMGGESAAVLLFAALMYAGPPLVHWGIIPMKPEGAALMGIPVVRRRAKRSAPEGSSAAATEWPERPGPGGEPSGVEFHGEANGGPPTFTETPLG